MIYRLKGSRFLFTIAFAMILQLGFGQEPNINEGKTLFRNNCAQCHNKNMVDDMTGPALGGVEERWAEYPQEDLYAWIRNSQALIGENHPRAVQVYEEWNKAAMNAFPTLTDQEIANLLGYISSAYQESLNPTTDVAGAPGGGAGGAGSGSVFNNRLMYILLAGILAILALVLARIVSNLNYLVQTKEEGAAASRKTVVEILTSKGVVAFVIFCLVVLGGYTTVNNAIMLGRQQGYQPEQPIKFSHATHAGLQKIECQYCHDGARRSKHSVIPAANTCMNCHKAIKVGSKYGTAELTKIYASIGYDPNGDSMIANYDELSEAQIKRIYQKWIADTYIKDKGELDFLGEELIEDQWEGIKTSLTNENKKKIQGPIEWVRIHNLPDHAYFNHAQHVSVGKVECQSCHGKVEGMEVVEQVSPLSMGWCINCHRRTEVNFKDNEYYKSYEKYHKELTSGKREKVTVEEIGGLECQKCHY